MAPTKEESSNLLLIMEKIEKTISDIYAGFAVHAGFSDETRRFWTTMMEAELEHAALFREVREKVAKDKSVQIDINATPEQLRTSYKKVKNIEKLVMEKDVSEPRAFSVGAFIEEGLFEFSYSKRVKSNRSEILDTIKKVENDTKHHYFTLHNYSLKYEKLLKKKGPSKGS